YRRRFDAYDLAGLVIFKAQGKTWEEYLATRQPLALTKEAELHRLYSIEDLSAIATAAGDRHLIERLKGFSMEDAAGERASLVRDAINGWGEERFYKHIDERLSGPDRENSPNSRLNDRHCKPDYHSQEQDPIHCRHQGSPYPDSLEAEPASNRSATGLDGRVSGPRLDGFP